MNRVKSYIGMLACVFFISDASGYAYQIHVMRIFNRALKRYHYLIGCCDYHEKSHPANQTQRSYLESLIKQIACHDLKCIVEDLASANSNGRVFCCGYVLNSCGILGGLANTIRLLGKDVENIEYRYCRVASVGPLLNNVTQKPEAFKSSTSLTMSAVYNEVLNEIDYIKRYNDGAKLNGFYKRSIDDVIRGMYRLSFAQSKNQSVAQYCARLDKKKYRERLQELCMFDSVLIDIKLVHAIISAHAKPYIIMVAGGTHINNSCTLLEQIGYEHVFSTPVSLAPEALKSSLHTHTNSSTHNRPQPVDLRIIEKFLTRF